MNTIRCASRELGTNDHWPSNRTYIYLDTAKHIYIELKPLGLYATPTRFDNSTHDCTVVYEPRKFRNIKLSKCRGVGKLTSSFIIPGIHHV